MITPKKIWQKDNYHFGIIWSDGSEQIFRLSDLQKKCPCAKCVDENTGIRTSNPDLVSDDIKAFKIKNIGQYGLQIYFTNGCSSGIYSYKYLKKLNRE